MRTIIGYGLNHLQNTFLRLEDFQTTSPYLNSLPLFSLSNMTECKLIIYFFNPPSRNVCICVCLCLFVIQCICIKYFLQYTK